ncbi:hypothetical protein RSAG8_05378, partial [Rhizoctonia solani AG-8 WAC10335]
MQSKKTEKPDQRKQDRAELFQEDQQRANLLEFFHASIIWTSLSRAGVRVAPLAGRRFLDLGLVCQRLTVTGAPKINKGVLRSRRVMEPSGSSTDKTIEECHDPVRSRFLPCYSPTHINVLHRSVLCFSLPSPRYNSATLRGLATRPASELAHEARPPP